MASEGRDATVDLLGIGCSEQLGVVKQVDLARRYAAFLEEVSGDRRLARRASFLFARAGVDERRMALAEQGDEGVWGLEQLYASRTPTTAQRMVAYRSIAPALAVEAAQIALDTAEVEAGQIGSLVVATCTGLGDPDFDVELVTRLGLCSSVERSQLVWMSCSGAFPALRIARRSALAHNKPSLLVCVELCSLHIRADADPGSLLAHALFADGAAALVVGPPSAEEPLARLHGGQSRLVPEARDALTWQFTDHGFRANLSVDLPSYLARETLPFVADGLLVRPAEVDSWVVHPGGPAILDAVEQSLSLPRDALGCAREVLRTHGNMSSSTILYVLREQLKRMAPAERGLMLGFGTGITIEGVPFTRGTRPYQG
jgi:predicted naringenin-chalcone synthase